jgi:phosphotransferase system HPr (HPr) family protein
MIIKKLKVQAVYKKEARWSALLTRVANQFDSQTMIENGDKMLNAKNLMDMMFLGTSVNKTLIIHSNGSDELAAAEAIKKYLLTNLLGWEVSSQQT